MPDYRPTYELAANQIAAYVQPLWPGALAMTFEARDEDGRLLNLDDDHLSGRYLLLAFLNDSREKSAVPVLKAIAAQRPLLEQCSAAVIAISSSSDADHNGALKSASGFRWPVAGDPTGATFASYGLHKNHGAAIRIVVLTPYRQVRVWFDTPDDIDETMQVIMELLKNSQIAEEARWAPPHAPVLLTPNVFSPEECGRLIESFESGGPFIVRPPMPGEVHADYKIPVYEHNRQDRVDHIVKDRNTLAFLDERIAGRIVPMVKKAFAFDITRHENLHIARYAGERSGNKMGHRDNTSAAASYRRFALTVPLNDDYEGGEIVFREYSPRGYRPEPGTAVVFSSSLLHEILETAKGVRYALITHFYNEESLAKWRAGTASR